jgi:hypothetical protein
LPYIQHPKATYNGGCVLHSPASEQGRRRVAVSTTKSKNYKNSFGSVIEGAGEVDRYHWTLVVRCHGDLKGQEFLHRLQKQLLAEGTVIYLYVALVQLLSCLWI